MTTPRLLLLLDKFFFVSLLFVARCEPSLSQSLQPVVTTLESHPSRRSAGIITLPEGSPWCKGHPTILISGHQNSLVDSPFCYIEGEWQRPRLAELDVIDGMNAVDDSVMDRHECGVIDANNDGRLDLYCLVGANKGKGVGYNELYLTRPNGMLRKVRRHGLQRFRGSRTRHTVTLKGANDTELLFIATNHGEREDGKYNKHSMYVKSESNHAHFRFFDLAKDGPWKRYGKPSCVIANDINHDGLDDLILCNQKEASSIFVQNVDGSFKEMASTHKTRENWRNARLADFDGDGLQDIAVVYHSEEQSFLRIFRGVSEAPYFDFRGEAYFSRTLQYAAPDIEAMDVNNDGVMDLYIVQANESTASPDNYCGGWFRSGDWFSGGPSRVMPPSNYTPPVDTAPDLLLIGNPSAKHRRYRFEVITMSHREPGCGYYAKKFGERSMVLSQGGFVRPGHQLLLEW